MNKLHQRNRRRKIFWTIIITSIVLFFLYQLIKAPIDIEDLKNNRIVTSGIVTGATSNQKNTGGGIKYMFYVNSKGYKGSTGYSNLSRDFCESLIGRNFPVIYSPERTENNKILLTNDVFNMYGMIQPDSLKWIEKYVNWR